MDQFFNPLPLHGESLVFILCAFNNLPQNFSSNTVKVNNRSFFGLKYEFEI
uniref:Uncharacterized protein n=1 Tax=Rhizophora mucronata TaxID=61149 RepID=A0A2P2PHK7_RHIMU